MTLRQAINNSRKVALQITVDGRQYHLEITKKSFTKNFRRVLDFSNDQLFDNGDPLSFWVSGTPENRQLIFTFEES